MRLWLSVCACVLVPVGGAPPARSPHASFARSGRSRSPARPSGPSGVLHTSGAGCADDWLGVSSRSPVRPCRRVACFVGPGRCVCRWAAARPRDRHTRAALGVVDLEARPGPAAAHQHRGQAPQASRRPPIGRGVCVMPGQAPQASRRPRSVGLVVCVLTGSAVAHLRRGQVLQPLRRPPHRRGLVCWCVVRRSVISHAIRRPHCAGLYQFVMSRHLCL